MKQFPTFLLNCGSSLVLMIDTTSIQDAVHVLGIGLSIVSSFTLIVKNFYEIYNLKKKKR